MKHGTIRRVCSIVIGLAAVGGCQDREQGDQRAAGDKISLAFVTNNPSDFWKIATKGVEKAEKEFGVKCEVRLPPNGSAAEQKQITEDLVAAGIKGMAISPVDPANQTEMLNAACERMHVICHDSDAPDSKRMCYVGTINYKAGLEAGKLVKEVLPDGGKIMLFVGTLDASNARERRRGLMDAIKGTKIEVIDTRTDDTDRVRAKANVEGTLTAHPDVACLVGLWEYNGPAILNAVRDAKRAGLIPVVCFDENAKTLEGIRDGHIHATVVQSPYDFGYHSVRILAAVAKGDMSVVPENKIYEVPVKVIRKDNVEAFRKKLEALLQ